METAATALPLVSMNHVSFVCRSVNRSVTFYVDVLGFRLIKRPSSFKFEGAWLFNYGIGIHLLECNSADEMPRKKDFINPKDNHISFQCSDMKLLKRKLEEKGIDYVTAVVEEGGILVDQIFFHDPDGYMVEICNCENIPILPISSCSLKNTSLSKIREQDEARCSNEVANEMIERLVTDILGISF
ncbi:glyoxylase I 4-like [Aristolochia californica]|uniref:glyoxylase I 4-like n=1 Tax=Aristolochia californica TaxID=171875 RepID=UPI0035DC7BC1